MLAAGGFANVAAHEAFCPDKDCVISNVFDQSPQGNHLGQRHKLVNASEHKIWVGDDVPVYGMWFEPGYGYHVDKTTGIAMASDNSPIHHFSLYIYIYSIYIYIIKFIFFFGRWGFD